MMNNVEKFEKDGYLVVKNFLDTKTTEIISRYLENRINRGEWKSGSEVIHVSKYFYYGDPLIEVLLLESKETIENLTGKDLDPTYSYTRIYQSEDILHKHIDRPSCEISVTVNIANKGKKSPIFMKYKNNDSVECFLDPGDAVVYKGCEVYHWRDKLLEDQLVVQFMLHYVDKNGQNSKYKKDGRFSYGMKSPVEME
jgi:hypothetical protein